MRSQLTDPNTAAYKLARREQTRAYQTGEALRCHANAAHGGEVSESCPACQEIQRKMEFSTAIQK